MSRSIDKPRLLVLASTYPRWRGDPEPGFVHELCRRLALRFHVTVVTPDAAGADPSGDFDGVRVLRYRYAPRGLQTLVSHGGILGNLRYHPWKWALLPTFFLGMIRQARREWNSAGVDVVHAHWLIPQGLVAALLGMGRKHNPPLLVTSHGADLFALGSGKLQALKRFVARRANAITVVSAAMLERAQAIGMDVAKISVMPMGVDLRFFSPDDRVSRADSTLLFVGRLVEKKGLRHLLDAMPLVLAQIPEARLKVAGFGPEESGLRQQAHRLGIADRVEFLGGVPQERLPNLYREAAVLVAPFVEAASGDVEGLGLVIVEAIGCGCPVVTTAIPAVKEVFGGNWPEFCATPGSPESIASNTIALLRDRVRVRASSAALLPSLRQRFDWEVVADKYADLLQAIAGR